jgi:hypothetical protein
MLISVFMAAYYMFFAPSARVPEQETVHAVAVSDLRSIAECALAMHNAQISGATFNDICVDQNEIKSEFICLDAKNAITECEASGIKKPKLSLLVTATGKIHTSDYNEMMEILEKNFATTGSFGILQDGMIVSGGTALARAVPEAIQEEMELEDGQLVYMSHYDIPDPDKVFTGAAGDNITCPVGTNKTYRFGRWQCIGYNLKTSCGGDLVWDASVMECVPDESRKPLCAGRQTAIIVDEVWECVNPFTERNCGSNLVARLNYETLEWECVEDPNKIPVASKCSAVQAKTHRGRGGASLRITSSTCTECEKMVVDEETCVTVCVPDATKITDQRCYPGRSSECSGESRAFYFGFPNATYVRNAKVVAESMVPFDSVHSQNRKFNCLDCGTGTIDRQKSQSPFVAVCE